MLASGIVFGQVLGHERINFDDNVYVWDNARVQRGLTMEGIRWAMTTFYFANWHPLTWMSHMLDCQLWGLVPGKHLLTSVVIHTAASLVLLLACFELTRAFWPSAMVAALFAVHPIHVESVAWVAERKDVLSGLFWMLALHAYARYGRAHGAWGWYAASIGAFALGLMSKPMVVTFPFVLLLLDLWPLERFSLSEPRKIVALALEKTPFFVLSAGASVMTFLAQRAAGAVQDAARFPLAVRLGNAAMSYATYLFMTFVPARLAAYYPYPRVLPIGKVLLCAAVVAGCSVLAVRWARTRPYVLVGWLWFLGTLVPVIGLVQVGGQAMADRYTYVPAVGLFLAICFGAAEILRTRPAAVPGARIAAALILFLFVFMARVQVSFWHDMLTLFSHTVEVTPENQLAQCSLADALRDRGRLEEAVTHYKESIRIAPDYFEAHNNLASVLVTLGRPAEAVDEYKAALALKPLSAMAFSNLGDAYRNLRKFHEANESFERAIALDATSLDAKYNWGLSLTEEGRIDDAVARYQEVIAARPDHVNARLALGVTLERQGKLPEAIAAFTEAAKRFPQNAEAQSDLGHALALEKRLDEAATHLEEAVRLRSGYAEALNTLGVVRFQQARYKEAADAFERVLRIKPGDESAKKGLDAARQQGGKAVASPPPSAAEILKKALTTP